MFTASGNNVAVVFEFDVFLLPGPLLADRPHFFFVRLSEAREDRRSEICQKLPLNFLFLPGPPVSRNFFFLLLL